MHACLGLSSKQAGVEGQNGLTRQAFCAYNGLSCQTALDLAIENFNIIALQSGGRSCFSLRDPGLRDNDVEVI
jgi:hypothetical protein